jgi:PAS domain S-box-containing protein
VLGLILFASSGVAFSWLAEATRRGRRALREALERERRSRSGITKAITDNASLGLVMMDARQQCTFLNPAAERIFGYTLAEVQAKNGPLHDIVHHTRPDGSPFPMAECPIDRALPQRMREQGEDVFVRPDGTFYPVAFTASPIVENGVAVGTILEVEDVSERKRAAEELSRAKSWLEASEARLRLVIEHAPQGVALFDREMRYLFASRKWRDDYRLGDGDWSGKCHYDLFPELPEVWRAVHHRALAGATERCDGEPFLRANGTVQWVRWEVRPWHDAGGAIGGIIIFSEEITAVMEATRRLEDAIRLRDDFLAIASHELRTPLTALQLQLQGMRHLLSKQGGNDDDRFARKLEGAARQTVRLGRLIDELLDVSRISLGRLSLQPERVDLAEIAREVVEAHAAEARASGCTLRLDGAPSAMGEWDRLRMEQVIGNLIANAVKYGPGQRIEVRIEVCSESARVLVRDHGIGVRPEDARRIFGRFERAVSSTHYGGLGLGLYISEQIVDAHGGTIDVRSEPGQGSVFTVTLPRRCRPRRAVAREKAA